MLKKQKQIGKICHKKYYNKTLILIKNIKKNILNKQKNIKFKKHYLIQKMTKPSFNHIKINFNNRIYKIKLKY